MRPSCRGGGESGGWRGEGSDEVLPAYTEVGLR